METLTWREFMSSFSNLWDSIIPWLMGLYNNLCVVSISEHLINQGFPDIIKLLPESFASMTILNLMFSSLVYVGLIVFVVKLVFSW